MKKIFIWFSVLMVCFYFSLSFAQEPELTQKSIEKIVNNDCTPLFRCFEEWGY